MAMKPVNTRGWDIKRKIEFYSAPAEGGCILWQLTPTGAGYGQVWREGRYVMVHRAALELKLGRPIREGMQACHSCHNPLCVNPEHLREGTAKENIEDRTLSGRGAYGERAGGAKLKEWQVRLIKNDLRPEKVIAKEYSVGANVIGEIRRGKIWRHITLPR